MYNQQKLDELWDLIKGSQSIFGGEYVGLTEVKFDIPLEEFRCNHKKAVGLTKKSQVLTNLDDAINIISLSEVKGHHLSCVADTGYGDNSAFCIHYLNKSENQYYALAIPGVNYIATDDT